MELLERDLVHEQQVAEAVGQGRGAGDDAADERQQERVVGGLGVEGLGDDGREVLVGSEGKSRWNLDRGAGYGGVDVGRRCRRRRRIHGTRLVVEPAWFGGVSAKEKWEFKVRLEMMGLVREAGI